MYSMNSERTCDCYNVLSTDHTLAMLHLVDGALPFFQGLYLRVMLLGTILALHSDLEPVAFFRECLFCPA